MTVYMIYLGDVPLTWNVDEETAAAAGFHPCFISFQGRKVAERVMAEVPSLFDLDECDAATLNVREINIPG